MNFVKKIKLIKIMKKIYNKNKKIQKNQLIKILDKNLSLYKRKKVKYKLKKPNDIINL